MLSEGMHTVKPYNHGILPPTRLGQAIPLRYIQNDRNVGLSC
jgi:hypothetical protein